jgi:hypothetical protein
VALYPGWDSLDSVRTWHTVFEISGIAFLALLVGAEILAFQYGHRKDELTAVAESAAETKRQGDADAAENRRKADVDALKKQLSEADKKVADLQAQNVPRHLKDGEKAKLIAFLTTAPKGELTINANIAAKDARTYADEIAVAVNSVPGWTVEVNNSMFPGNSASGFWVTVKDANAAPVRAISIHEGFLAASLPMDPTYRLDTYLQPDEVWLSVGFK